MTDEVDLLLLTALTEEEQVVEAALELAATRVKRKDYLALYDYTYEDQVFRVATQSACHQGAVAMGIFASSVFAELRPRLAALVGIAAAVDLTEVGLGDVPCTTLVLSYDDIKVRSGKLIIRSGGYPTDNHLVRAIEKLRTSPITYRPWRKACRTQIKALVAALNEDRPKQHPNKQIKTRAISRDPDIVAAITAGGPFLIHDADFRDDLRKPRDKVPKHTGFTVDQPLHPKLVSAEMESHGFMQAAAFHRVPAIVLKGISDLGDERKAATEKRSGGFFRAYACSNAVLAALHMLQCLPREHHSPVPEKSLWEKMSDYASNVFTWGNPIVVHGDAEQYASFAQSLLNDGVTYVLWTVNGSPLDVSDVTDAHQLTAWDKAFKSVECAKRRLVVFRSEGERKAYIHPRTTKHTARRKAFQVACGEALRFTSVPKLHERFPGLASEAALDIGFVSTDGKGLCFCSPFATRDLGKQMPTCAPIVLFSTAVEAPNPHGHDHEESGRLLGRLHAYRYFIGEVMKPDAGSGWLYSNPSAVPQIPDKPLVGPKVVPTVLGDREVS